jgi:hypothetical protein
MKVHSVSRLSFEQTANQSFDIARDGNWNILFTLFIGSNGLVGKLDTIFSLFDLAQEFDMIIGSEGWSTGHHFE